MNRYVLRALLKAAEGVEHDWMDEYAVDPEKTMKAIEKEAQPAGFEKFPLVSVQQGQAIFVEFKTEAREVTGKDGKPKAYATVEILVDTPNGWDSEVRKQITLKEGDKAGINLKRHANLWRGAQANAPLAGKKFMIANLKDKVKTKQGSACDYRFVAL